MEISKGEHTLPSILSRSRRRFLVIFLGCIVVGFCSLWSRNFVEVVPDYKLDPISTFHPSLIRENHPIAFVWPGWDGVSENVWEYDFYRELFPPPLFVHVNASIAPGIMKCSDNNHVNDILQHARKGHVKVVIQSSDEYGGKNEHCNECFKTFKAVPLGMRQYALHQIPNKYIDYWLTFTGINTKHFWSGIHAEKEYPNVLQLPLGYMTGMLRTPIDNQQHHPSTDYALWSLSVPTVRRKYKWTFIGTMKQDRLHAVTTFRSWTSAPHFLKCDGLAGEGGSTLPQHSFCRNNVSVGNWEMGQIYNNTVFVIVGRGWIIIDSIRIYEAIIGGAIPLVVGDATEISRLFHYNGDVMPLLTADSWDKMLVICQSMTNEQIDHKREELSLWYVNKMKQIKDRIIDLFNESTSSSSSNHTHKIRD